MERLCQVVALAGAVLAGAWGVDQIGAQEEPKPVKSPRGGLLAKAGSYQFEVFFYPTGVRVFPRDSAGGPVSTRGVGGTITFFHPNSPNPWFARPLEARLDVAAPSLDVAVGLGSVPPTGAKATIEVTSLGASPGAKVTFTVPVEFTPAQSESVASQPSAGSRPPYYYGPGYSGYGYYQNVGPQSAPARTVSPGGHLGHAPSYDWSVGRTNPLAKPWLRPWD